MNAATAARLVLIGAGLLSAAGCVLDADMGETGMFTRTLEVSGPVDLGVRTGSGHIRIETGPENTVRVVAHIQAYGHLWGGISASEQVKRLEANPPIEQEGNTIRIGEISDPELRNVSISYDLVVPPQTRIRSSSGSGGQTIDAVQGPVHATAGSGRLRIGHVRDHVRAFTGSGRIEALGADGGLDAQAGSGSVYAEGIGGAIRIRTGSGHVDVSQVNPGPVDVVAGSGAVTLRMPPHAAADLDARTGSGSIESDFPIHVQGTTSAHHLRGRLGPGGPRVALSTGSGRIRIQ